MNETLDHLLAPNDPAPVTVYNENGSSPFLIVADHAGNSMPCGLGRLGVPESEWERHIAWDIGIAGVCRFMAAEARRRRGFARLVNERHLPTEVGAIERHVEEEPQCRDRAAPFLILAGTT